MALDLLDVVIVDALQVALGEPQVGFGENYQMFDKWLDMYYLSIEAVVCLGWPNRLAKVAAIALFVFRLAGISAFEVTGEEFRKLIFFFPNLFENFFLYYIICDRFAPRLIPTKIKSLLFVLLLLYVPKFAQEVKRFEEKVSRTTAGTLSRYCSRAGCRHILFVDQAGLFLPFFWGGVS